MIKRAADKFWHKTLRRPYILARPYDKGEGVPVVFLHGLASSSDVWRQTVEHLGDLNCRLVCLDLLGFGNSAKPDWPEYNVSMHAKAVIDSLERLELERPAVLVGHSMGCLVAVHVAYLRPDLVEHLILFEMPIYALPNETRRYRLQRDMRFMIYRHFLNNPKRTLRYTAYGRRIASKAGFHIDETNWAAFSKSLANTVMSQKTFHELNDLRIKTDVIYGTRDIFVLRASTMKVLRDSKHIDFHNVREIHGISPKASHFIHELVEKAVKRLQLKERRRQARKKAV